jgi:hypothetical protein
MALEVVMSKEREMIRLALGLIFAVGGVGMVEVSIDAFQLIMGIMYALIGALMILWKVTE